MTANWYKELKEINETEKIIAIAVRKNKDWGDEGKYPSKFFTNLEDAKEMLNYNFDDGYGGTEGPFFTAWTNDTVYFPAEYDGAEWIASVPRNPCNDATSHIGGG